MYKYELSAFKMHVFDDKNQQHKIVELQYPKTFFSYEDAEMYLANMVSKLNWIPNKVLRRLPVYEQGGN